MNDLISRQAALYAIYEICNEPVAWLIRAAREIEKLPSAQPEKIRCKDCKYRYVDGFNLCALNHNKVQSDDWYCADAEREENDG